VRRTPTIITSCCLIAVATAVAPPALGRHAAYAAATINPTITPAITPASPIPATTTTATGVAGGATLTPSASGTAQTGVTATVTTTATATATVTVTTPTATRTPAATRTARATATRTATPHPTARPTARPTATPRATPNPHPGFGAAAWTQGEYYAWTISGRDIVSGTAYQLYTRSGHQWVDSAAYTLVEQQKYALMPSATTFASRIAFDVNTYRLRRYDGVGLRQSNDPDDSGAASVLRATLFGPHLDYTSYQTWGPASGAAHRGCTVTKGLMAPASTVAYGMMQDLLRTISPDATRPVTYTVLDPYGARPTATASYRIQGHDTLSTVLGTVATVHVRFLEGAQPPLDVWYTTGRGHVVVKWGMPGAFGATLAHYEKSGARTTLPVGAPKVALPANSMACA